MQCTGTRTRATHTAAFTHGSTYAWMPTHCTHLHAKRRERRGKQKEKGRRENRQVINWLEKEDERPQKHRSRLGAQAQPTEPSR